MTAGKPGPAERSSSYAYPRPAPDVTEPGPTEGGHSAGQLTWKGPVAPGGSVAFTTPRLKDDMVLAGPASLDLWLESGLVDFAIARRKSANASAGLSSFRRTWARTPSAGACSG